MAKNGSNNKGPNDLEHQIEFLKNQNEVLKVAIRKAVHQVHTLRYENNVLNRKVKLAEDWVGELRGAGL
tara:strand:+ start:1266 stop:1472 length:207 start_codon:yes stop_codon:yes gene_type:complete